MSEEETFETEEDFAKLAEAEEAVEEEVEETDTEEAPQEEVKAEAQEEVQEEVEPELVPKNDYDGVRRALDEARGREKELKQELAEFREKQARLEGQMESFRSLYGDDEEEQDPVQMLQKRIEDQEQKIKENQERANKIELMNTLNSQEAQFASTRPDYDQAKKHYFDARLNSLKRIYDEETAQKELIMEITRFSQSCLDSNKNAAEALYNAAQDIGYRPVTQESEKKLEKLQENQESAKSMPSGSAPKSEYTLEQLNNLPQEEFNSLPEEVIRKALGA